jgi:hypothetical protein
MVPAEESRVEVAHLMILWRCVGDTRVQRMRLEQEVVKGCDGKASEEET